jgi:hypothetical protein
MARFKVWHIPQVPMPVAFEREYADFATARLVQDVLSDYDAFEFKHNVKGDYCNVSGISMAHGDSPGEDDWFDVEPCEECGFAVADGDDCDECMKEAP